MAEHRDFITIEFVKSEKPLSGILVERDLSIAILANGRGLAIRLSPEDAINLAAKLSDLALEAIAREAAAATAVDADLARIVKEHGNA